MFPESLKKILEFIHVFFKNFAKNLSNFVHTFWKDYFHKPKLLLAASMLIYLNISTDMSLMHF